MLTPRFYSIASGTGESEFALLSFDNALRQAGIGDFNIIKVSSILPPNCKFQESISVSQGSILYAAYSTITVKGNDIGKTGVAVAIPTSCAESGVIFEYSSLNEKLDAGNVALQMCEVAMNNRGKPFNTIKKSSQEVRGNGQTFATAISAVVMW